MASSPLVPQNDPTLMFVNSGMVQFKDVFTGKETRPYSRATTAQKSVRAGGKHNDLDNVGYTARHHTFFEMLGNFSFGDYFKDDAIPFAWELVTKNFGLPADKLLVTVHSTDEEAAAIWKKVTGFPDNKIIRIPTDDNFWRMGDTGPCGPCTEIFYDHGDHIWGGPPGSPEEDGDRFIEIWNLVFMQFEQLADKRIDLPKQSVDTGMGLERISAILQGVHSNYEIDLFQKIIGHISDLTGEKESASHRVIADHLRAAAFLLADGVMPSNEGRGYVLRRIMRRGMRHAHLLGAQDPLMYKLMPTLTSLMGEAYPELNRASAMITDTLKNEETRFKTTLDRGLKLLDEEASGLGEGQTLSGDVAFKLYDTYGFPLDLTQDALRARNIEVDMEGFNAAMTAQKQAARAAWSGTGDTGNDKLWFDLLDELGTTEFLGYETESAEGQIIALVKEGNRVEQLDKGEEGVLILNQTPFYAESGGQVGDTGVISGENYTFRVRDTLKKSGGLWAHVGVVEAGTLKASDIAYLKVDQVRRNNIRTHHSVTHLLHEALRQKLGDHIAQKGSLQAADRTRFDISHNAAISAEELKEIEYEVNREILANTPVETRVMGIDEAMETGARALFGEKYGDEVRVVSMGTRRSPPTPPAGGGEAHSAGGEKAKVYSVELCGGTHVKNTGEIGCFKIISESAVSAGVRRVEALAGQTALDYLAGQEKLIKETSHLLKTPPEDVPARVKTLLDEKKKLEQEVGNLRRQLATGGADASNDAVKEINGVKFVARVLPDMPAKDLKPMADDLKKKLGSGVVALIATNEGKASVVVGVTQDLTERYNAVDLVKTASEALGGQGGGGRPDMAQAGGPDGAKADDAVSALEAKIA